MPGMNQDDEDFSNQRRYEIDRPEKDVFLSFSNERRCIIYQNMDEQQQHRFDDFISSGLNENQVKDLM